MEYFTEQAESPSECLAKIREKYGDRAQVMIQRAVRIRGLLPFITREGIEMTGIVPNEYPRYGGTPGKGSQMGQFSFPGSGKPTFAQAAGNISGSTAVKGSAPMQQLPDLSNPEDLEGIKKEILRAAGRGGDGALKEVASDLKIIKEKLDALKADSDTNLRDHPNLQRLDEILEKNEFSPNYRRELLDKLRKELTLDSLNDFESLQDRVLEYIGEDLSVFPVENGSGFRAGPRIFVLVGPTGVGKTTTIAKLAAMFGVVGKNPLKVRIITIDNYRIGAGEQLKKMGDIMRIPVSTNINDFNDLKKTIQMFSRDTDLILIDTVGRSQKAAMELAEMKEMLDACGRKAEFHLAMSATTKYSDMVDILRQFEPFNYRSVIVTKTDETTRVGNVLSALKEKGKSVSYVTQGQVVPTDIERAEKLHFLMNLDGFVINREKFEKLFPALEGGTIRWS